MIGLGIDFGTSNSAAAWFDGETIQLIHIEPNAQTVPTAIHLDQEFQTLTGSEAIRCYVDENTDRRVEITAKAIGEIDADPTGLFGDGPSETGGNKQIIYGAAEDYGLPGRLFLGIKRLLGKAQIKRLMVFERPFRLVALVTPIMVSIRQAMASFLTQPHQPIYLGRPVDFEGKGSGKNSLAVDRLAESSEHARLGEIVFYPEPVAASLSFIHKQGIEKDSTILTIDFGGGTLDLSLVNFRNKQFTVLGTEGVAIGGDYIDQLIYETLVFPELGRGIQWSRTVDGLLVETPFPFDQYEKGLLNWTITHTLNQNQYLSRIHEFINQANNADTEDKEKLERLRDIILHNYSYLIFQAIKSAKASLSDEEDSLLDIPEINLTLALSRTQLNDIIESVLKSLRHCIDNLLARTGVVGEDIHFVMRTGGSSKLTAVVDLLDELFPGKVVQHDTFTSVASGLAVASYYQHHCDVE